MGNLSKLKNPILFVFCFVLGITSEYFFSLYCYPLWGNSFIECVREQPIGELFFDVSKLFSALIIGGIEYYYISVLSHRQSVGRLELILSALFGFSQIVCLDVHFFKTFFFSLTQKSIVIFNGIVFLLYGFLFLTVACSIKYWLLETSPVNTADYSAKDIKIEKFHTFLIVFSLWFVWLLVFYPGTVMYDLSVQLLQFLGLEPYYLHPYFSTLCVGFFYSIGDIISSNVGIFLYVVFQTIICAYSIACIAAFLRKLGVNKRVKFGFVLFYSLCPLFGATVQTAMKDVISTGWFVLFYISFLKYVMELNLSGSQSTAGIKDIIELLAISLLCVLFRHEMILVCGLCLFLLIISAMFLKKWNVLKQCSVALLGMITVFILFEAFVVSGLERKDRAGGLGSEEMLSIPLQQVARVVTYSPESVSAEEQRILNECFDYGYEGISLNYNPYLSDSIKFHFEDNGEFIKVWLSLLKKQPITYVESIIHNSYGYYSITPTVPITLGNAPTNGWPGMKFFFNENIYSPEGIDNPIVVERPKTLENLREFFENWAESFGDIPGLGILYKMGAYTWFLIYLCLLTFSERKSFLSLVPFVPAALCICVCIASPVNEHLRYFFRVIAVTPLLTGWTIYYINRKNGEH